jgi:hypothetical protein
MTFQIHALPATKFRPLFALSDRELVKARATRMVVDSNPGYPCRVSLVEADIGETVILVNFQHQSADSPYRASHAIFVRENAEQAFPSVGVVPQVLEARLISIRAFDEKHYMLAADVVEGLRLTESIPAMLQDPKVSYLHLHNAKRGCFAARVTRPKADRHTQ